MLKFSGYPYLIRGQSLRNNGVVWPARSERLPKRDVKILLRLKSHWTATEFQARHRGEAQYQAVLEGCNDARTGMPFGIPKGAMCVQRFDDSRNSAIHITFRISLRSSSMPEPRDPLLKVLIDSSSTPTYRNSVKVVHRGPARRPGRPRGNRCWSTKGWRSGRGPSLGNDPSAGSPTETLLRLLLPLNDRV